MVEILWMEEILHQLIGGLSTIQGGAGFLPSTVYVEHVEHRTHQTPAEGASNGLFIMYNICNTYA